MPRENLSQEKPLAKRPCLRCREMFQPQSRFNGMCPKCHESPDYQIPSREFSVVGRGRAGLRSES